MRDAGCEMQDDKPKHSLSFRDLEIYQLSHQLAVEIHKMTLTSIPKFEQFEEGSQIRRSSKSISVNIVEGFGRRNYKLDYLKFLIYSRASCDETLEHLAFLRDTNSLNAQDANYFAEKYTVLGRKIYRFIKSVNLLHRSG